MDGAGLPVAVQRMRSRRLSLMRSSPSGLILTPGRLAVYTTEPAT